MSEDLKLLCYNTETFYQYLYDFHNEDLISIDDVGNISAIFILSLKKSDIKRTITIPTKAVKLTKAVPLRNTVIKNMRKDFNQLKTRSEQLE